MEVRKDAFFKKMDDQGLALTFGDVRLRTDFSDIHPQAVILKTKFSANISLNMPIVSSPMDTVTEAPMAIAMAKLGGLGIIHRGLAPKDQASMVGKVKFHLNALIKAPICVSLNDTVNAVMRLRKAKGYSFHSFPVLDGEGKLVGIVTKNDFDFASSADQTIGEIMSKDLITAPAGSSINDAYKLMLKNGKKILPLVSHGRLRGIYTFSDVKRILAGNSVGYSLDKNGGLLVGAAIGVGEDAKERLCLLSEERVDVVVIDTAHGFSQAVIDTIRYAKKNYPEIDVVAGNISEGMAASILAAAGVDGLRVGQGPGSSCLTRVITGVGRPQVSAVYDCAKALRGMNIPVCADGGIQNSDDIAIALAAGADNVMLGNLLAGTEESPGEIIRVKGMPYKRYRGMGSLEAMKEQRSSRQRYGQSEDQEKLVPEGVQGLVPDKGPLAHTIHQLTGGLRSSLGYLGTKDIYTFQKEADFFRITNVGLQESHPHHIFYADEAPNYKGH